MPTVGAPRLSIIIVNWNSGQYLRACLTSIREEVDACGYEVIVVDNASTIEDIGVVAAEFPWVTVVQSGDNVGFARANNLGYEKSVGELLLFLNPDTVVSRSALNEMVRTLESLPRAGILGCKLLNGDGSVQLSAIQPFPTILNQVFGVEFLQTMRPHWRLWGLDAMFSEGERPVQVQGVSGACLLIRRFVFEEVGLFSSEYFMYAEDVDLCCKAALAGWQTWFTPAVVVVHHGGGSSKQVASARSAVRQQQAKYRFLEKFRGRTYARLFQIALGMAAAVRVALFATAKALRLIEVEPQRTAKWMAILKWSCRSNQAA